MKKGISLFVLLVIVSVIILVIGTLVLVNLEETEYIEEVDVYVESFEIIFHDKSNLDFNLILDDKESNKYDYSIYSYGGDVNIIINDEEEISLREALINNKITMEKILEKCNNDVSEGLIPWLAYNDGGSQEYVYSNYTIVDMNSLENNYNIYIGNEFLNVGIINDNQ